MLKVTAEMTGIAGTPYYSSIYTDGQTSAQAQIAADAFREFWDDIKGYMAAGLAINSAPEVQLIDAGTGELQGAFAVSTTVVNTTGNAPLPAATQGLLRLTTNYYVAGRRLQGRLFIPRLANDAQTSALPSTAFVNAVETASGTLGAALSAAGGWVVWSRTHGDLSAVTGGSVWNKFAVLRSRRD